MARRRRTSQRAPMLVSALIVILILVGSGFAVWYIADPDRTKTRLDTNAYLDNPGSFAGNHYLLEGTLDSRIASDDRGTVYSILCGDMPLAMIVPLGATPSFNLQKGQKLKIDLRVAQNGALIATAFSKK